MNNKVVPGLERPIIGWRLSLLLLILSALAVCCQTRAQETIQLAWNAESGTTAIGYKVHYGNASKTYNAVIDVGTNTSAVITNCKAGTNYYFAVTAYNTAKLEGALSTEVMTTAVPGAFFRGQVSVSNNLEYLQFTNGTVFGYYSLGSFPWVYHEDLGLVFFVDAKDSQNGAYLYDPHTTTYWYTSPAVWPHLYDESLQAWLYYYPATNAPGHYPANPRLFQNTKSGKNITK